MSTGLDPKWCACLKRPVIECSCPPSSPWCSIKIETSGGDSGNGLVESLRGEAEMGNLGSSRLIEAADRIETLEAVLDDAGSWLRWASKQASGVTDFKPEVDAINRVLRRIEENKSDSETSTKTP